MTVSDMLELLKADVFPVGTGLVYDRTHDTMFVVDDHGLWLNGWHMTNMGYKCPCTTHSPELYREVDYCEGLPIIEAFNKAVNRAVYGRRHAKLEIGEK